MTETEARVGGGGGRRATEAMCGWHAREPGEVGERRTSHTAGAARGARERARTHSPACVVSGGGRGGSTHLKEQVVREEVRVRLRAAGLGPLDEGVGLDLDGP